MILCQKFAVSVDLFASLSSRGDVEGKDGVGRTQGRKGRPA